jgi:hypothetical protein
VREHREFSVAVPEASQIPKLREFLAGMARDLKEDCIYFRAGQCATLIYPATTAEQRPANDN